MLEACAANGSAGAPRSFTAGNTPVDVYAADFNADERTDLLITNPLPNASSFDTISVIGR